MLSLSVISSPALIERLAVETSAELEAISERPAFASTSFDVDNKDVAEYFDALSDDQRDSAI